MKFDNRDTAIYFYCYSALVNVLYLKLNLIRKTIKLIHLFIS